MANAPSDRTGGVQSLNRAFELLERLADAEGTLGVSERAAATGLLRMARRTGLPAMTEHTITRPELLLAELGRIRAQGYAADDGEQEVGVRCLAVPVDGAPGHVAVSVSGPSGRLTRERVPQIVPVLHRVAADLGAELSREAG